jgi:hypothetical protein
MDLQRGTSPSARPLPGPLAELRRRDADVDIVVLPPDRTPADEPVDDAVVDAATARAEGLASRLWAGATDVPASPLTRVGYGPAPGTVVARSRILASVPDGEEVVQALAGVLAQSGWRVGWAPQGPRLVARRDDVVARVSYAEVSGALLVDVASDPMLVGPDQARRLVRS